jgi:hypothetical protein
MLFSRNTEKRREAILMDSFYQEEIQKIREDAKQMITSSLDEIPYSIYRLFFTTGDRKEYQSKYFARRQRLNVYAFMSLFFREEKYIQALEDVIWAICNEYTWELPAHVLPSDPIELQKKSLGLFAAETGYTLSEICYLLNDLLPCEIKERVTYEVQIRIIDNFVHAKVPFSWENSETNWAAVCAGSIGNAMMYLGKDNEFESAKSRLFQCMDNFLNGFPEDGACLEGYNYWKYGFGYYIQFAQAYKEYYNDDRFLNSNKVQKIAKFQQNGVVNKVLGIPFSDCPLKPFEQDLYISHFLYENFEDIELPPQNLSCNYRMDECFRWGGFIRNFFWTSPDFPKDTLTEKNTFFTKAQWYIKNSKNYSFLIKGGTNGEPHNHNDIGGFALASEGKYELFDLGAGAYEKDYFDEKKRYDYLVNSSRGHNVPIINRQYQKVGMEYSGTIIEQNESMVRIEYAQAYGIEDLKNLTRTVTFCNDTIVLNESWVAVEGLNYFAERFISFIRPKLHSGEVLLDNVSIEFNQYDFEVQISEEKYIDHNYIERNTYLIDLVVKDPKQQNQVEVKIHISSL